MDKDTIVAAIISVKKTLDDLMDSIESVENMPSNNIPALVLDGGEVMPIPPEWIEAWVLTYGWGFTMGSIKEACQWALDNPSKRKTKRGARKFLGGWLQRNYKKAGNATPTESLAGKYSKKAVN